MPVYALGAYTPDLPEIGQFWIAPTALALGRVVMKADASLWYGVVLRGDNDPIVIGERSNIQDNSVIHTDHGTPVLIGADVTVGHKVILHSCTVGDNSLIGMGSTLLSGAVVGRNCLVGANSLLTENKVFPDNSLIVGSPARVVRTLTDEQVAANTASAARYVANWRRHAAELALVSE
jgi:carbonic anhydrase/acetyltransferase-like protein (isoleucine patch superfamily)